MAKTAIAAAIATKWPLDADIICLWLVGPVQIKPRPNNTFKYLGLKLGSIAYLAGQKLNPFKALVQLEQKVFVSLRHFCSEKGPKCQNILPVVL